MSFAAFEHQQRVVKLLQRSLERERVAHAYLFTGPKRAELEAMAVTLAKVLNCDERKRSRESAAEPDCCDRCFSCQRIDGFRHPDVRWLRPESKLRVITIDQTRELMEGVHLKPSEALFKVAILAGADRMTTQAANSFLKTLEEPPARSVLILLSTEPQRIPVTILSRCLRIDFSHNGVLQLDASQFPWLDAFSKIAAAGSCGMLERYRLLGLLLHRLAEIKSEVEERVTARSPSEKFEDAGPEVKDRHEETLSAGIEAEYRQQRTELLAGLHWWLRDVWLQTLSVGADLSSPGQLKERASQVAERLNRQQAGTNLRLMDQIQRSLNTNVQEALTLEVGLLKLHL